MYDLTLTGALEAARIRRDKYPNSVILLVLHPDAETYGLCDCTDVDHVVDLAFYVGALPVGILSNPALGALGSLPDLEALSKKLAADTEDLTPPARLLDLCDWVHAIKHPPEQTDLSDGLQE